MIVNGEAGPSLRACSFLVVCLLLDAGDCGYAGIDERLRGDGVRSQHELRCSQDFWASAFDARNLIVP